MRCSEISYLIQVEIKLNREIEKLNEIINIYRYTTMHRTPRDDQILDETETWLEEATKEIMEVETQLQYIEREC